MKNKYIIVTGSSGFIAYHVINSLLKQNFKIIGIDNHNTYYDPKIKIKRKNLLKKNKNF